VEIRTKEGKLESYVFVRSPEGSDVDAVKESFAAGPGVQFVAQFVGAFVLFGRVLADDLTSLQAMIKGPYWTSGIRSDWSVNLTGSRDAAPKRGSPPICALVRVEATQDPFDLLNHFDDLFLGRVESYGAAVVTGEYDVLVDLGADTIEETVDLVVELRHSSGIGATATAFADLTENEIRRDQS
jgi:hypothetical protein